METDNLRQRAKRQKIRVTFPDGKIFCHGNVTDTFISVLCEIGSERFAEIALELCHLPLISKEVYPKYKEWMKPVCDGWYLNAQSSTEQKYIQLRSISDSLNLGLTVEIGYDFATTRKQGKTSTVKRGKEKLLVKFPDGEYVASHSPIEAYLQCLWKIGIDDIMRKGVEWSGIRLITPYQVVPSQVQVGADRWATIPTSTRDKARTLKVLAMHLKLNLEITTL